MLRKKVKGNTQKYTKNKRGNGNEDFREDYAGNQREIFRDLNDDEFVVTAQTSPQENIAEPISEILMWRPMVLLPIIGVQ